MRPSSYGRLFPSTVVLVLFLVCQFPARAQAADISVVINTVKSEWTISKYLVGMHIVYSSSPDKVFADGKVAAWAKNAGIATARFPGGGTVKTWDWKNPTGVPTADRWDPTWKPTDIAPPGSWMSLDEYLDFVARSGITPLFGVNSLSGYEHGKVEESVRRAADMVRYVKEKGYGGAFWYIGNEEENKYKDKVAGYAEIFRQHAAAMKEVDPNIRIFWNANYPTVDKIDAFLAHDGGTSDGLETHGKWPYGGSPPNYKPGTFREWLDESPLRDRKNNRQWRQAAGEYRQIAAKAGRRNYLIANNEYGIGKNKDIAGFDRYTYGLLMTDLLQDLFIGNWDMSCFWDTIRGDEDGLLSPNHDYRMNPFSFAMELLAEAQGREMLEVKTSNPRVYGFAARKGDDILLYLINKQEVESNLAISLSDGSAAMATGRVMRDTKDGWGELVALPVVEGPTTTASLPALSYGQIRLLLK